MRKKAKRLSKIGKIFCVGLSVLLVISVIFGWNQYEKRDFWQENIDLDFQTNFSLLCGVLNQNRDEEAQWNAMARMYAHTVNTVFAETSYADNALLSEVVHAVCSHAELGTLSEIANAEMAEALSRLAYDPENETLAKEIFEAYFK